MLWLWLRLVCFRELFGKLEVFSLLLLIICCLRCWRTNTYHISSVIKVIHVILEMIPNHLIILIHWRLNIPLLVTIEIVQLPIVLAGCEDARLQGLKILFDLWRRCELWIRMLRYRLMILIAAISWPAICIVVIALNIRKRLHRHLQIIFKIYYIIL